MISLSEAYSPWAFEHAIDRRTGVYFILNDITGDMYVGSAARDFNCRLKKHLVRLRNGEHHSPKLQASWNRHGAGVFSFGILEDCPPKDCLVREQFWINFYHPEYNVALLAASTRGLKHSEETKMKMRGPRPHVSARMMGHGFSKATLEKMSARRKGRAISLEVRQKLSVALKGRSKSPETIQKMRDAQNVRREKERSLA